MLGGAFSWLWDLAGAYLAVVLFCLGCGLFGVAFLPVLRLVERLEDRYGVDARDGGGFRDDG